MTITPEQALEYLDSVGVTLPEFMLQALMEQIDQVNSCLTNAGYSESSITLMKLYALGLFGLTQGDRYVSSQSAPSGASQSFRYVPIGARYNSLMSLLRGLDTNGCFVGIIPPNPELKAFGGMWSTTGSCDYGCA